MVVLIKGKLVTLSLTTVTFVQLDPASPGKTKFHDGYEPDKAMLGLFKQDTTPELPVSTKERLNTRSLNKAHSIPASAAKKALLVSLAEVLKFISLSAILATPRVIAKIILESVTAKSITKPVFCF